MASSSPIASGSTGSTDHEQDEAASLLDQRRQLEASLMIEARRECLRLEPKRRLHRSEGDEEPVEAL